MLKIAVFDSGWGGDFVAEYLYENIGVIEVERIIDWRNAELYLKKDNWETCKMVETAIRPYIYKVDVIVIASFLARCAVKYLRVCYPMQKFVQVEWPSKNLNSRLQNTIMVLTSSKVRKTLDYKKWRHKLKDKKVIEPEIDHWIKLVDDGDLSQEKIQADLLPYVKDQVDTIVLGNTHIWDIQDEIADVLGWQAIVLEPLESLMNQVCIALQLEGSTCCRPW